MTRGTERDAADCNIDNIDEYHALRDEALTNVKAPPPNEYDIAQFKDDDLSDCIARPEGSVV